MDAVSFFLVFLAIVLVGAVVWAGAGGPSGIFRRGRPGVPLEGGLLDGGFEQPVANLPPVLLPANAAPADVDRVRFALGLRGYRMDQVDQVLDDLRDQLAARNEEVERLRTQLAAAHDSAVPAAAPDPAPETPGRAAPEGGA
ncbi:MAG: hypothetical protein JWQ75_3194 [Pseudarthrobacter sp.]|nr:hypothetical protein [Pseudarthrobacter sp.]